MWIELPHPFFKNLLCRILWWAIPSPSLLMNIYVVPISFLPLLFVTLMYPVRRHLAWGWDVDLHPVLNGGVPERGCAEAGPCLGATVMNDHQPNG